MQEVNPKLIAQALAIGEHHDGHTVIEAALREYIRNHQRQDDALGLLDLFGMIEYEDTFDYKTQRQRE